MRVLIRAAALPSAGASPGRSRRGAGITGARTVKSGRLRSTISTTTASACRAAVKSSRYGTARENSASRNACAKKGSTALPKESRNISSRPVPLSFSVVMVMSSSLRKEEVYR